MMIVLACIDTEPRIPCILQRDHQLLFPCHARTAHSLPQLQYHHYRVSIQYEPRKAHNHLINQTSLAIHSVELKLSLQEQICMLVTNASLKRTSRSSPTACLELEAQSLLTMQILPRFHFIVLLMKGIVSMTNPYQSEEKHLQVVQLFLIYLLNHLVSFTLVSKHGSSLLAVFVSILRP